MRTHTCFTTNFCFICIILTAAYFQPRLQGALSLKQKGLLKGINGNRGRDVNRAGDLKSEEEKVLFERDRKIFKKLGPSLAYFAFLA